MDKKKLDNLFAQLREEEYLADLLATHLAVSRKLAIDMGKNPARLWLTDPYRSNLDMLGDHMVECFQIMYAIEDEFGVHWGDTGIIWD